MHRVDKEPGETGLENGQVFLKGGQTLMLCPRSVATTNTTWGSGNAFSSLSNDMDHRQPSAGS